MNTSGKATLWTFHQNKSLNDLELNAFGPNAPFLYPLKKSENLKVFLCFQGVEKECIGNEWVNRKRSTWNSLALAHIKFIYQERFTSHLVLWIFAKFSKTKLFEKKQLTKQHTKQHTKQEIKEKRKNSQNKTQNNTQNKTHKTTN